MEMIFAWILVGMALGFFLEKAREVGTLIYKNACAAHQTQFSKPEEKTKRFCRDCERHVQVDPKDLNVEWHVCAKCAEKKPTNYFDLEPLSHDGAEPVLRGFGTHIFVEEENISRVSYVSYKFHAMGDPDTDGNWFVPPELVKFEKRHDFEFIFGEEHHLLTGVELREALHAAKGETK